MEAEDAGDAGGKGEGGEEVLGVYAVEFESELDWENADRVDFSGEARKKLGPIRWTEPTQVNPYGMELIARFIKWLELALNMGKHHEAAGAILSSQRGKRHHHSLVRSRKAIIAEPGPRNLQPCG